MASSENWGNKDLRNKTKPRLVLRSVLLLAVLLLAILLLAMLSSVAFAASDESYGIVTSVLDGDTFDVAIEKADPRITSSVERIRLSDVNSPEMDTEGGLAARDFTYAVLMNKRVFLDIDDASGNGRDPYGRLVCVAYLTGVYGRPLNKPSFNQMLIDSGYAEIDDFTNNEFSLEEAKPDEGSQVAAAGYNLSSQLDDLKNDLLSQLRDSLANELDKRANETAAWLRGESNMRSPG